MKIKYRKFLDDITPVIGYRPMHKEIATILHEAGLVPDVEKSRNALGNRHLNDGWLPCEWHHALKEYYYLHSSQTKRGSETLKDICEIPYWEGAKDCVQNLISPFLTRPKVGDLEFVVKVKKRKIENLRIIAAPDNRMKGEPTRIEQGDILLCDMSETNPANEGVYFFTTKGKIAGIARTRMDISGNIVFTFDNKAYEEKIKTLEELEKLKFKVIGRVIMNYCYDIH